MLATLAAQFASSYFGGGSSGSSGSSFGASSDEEAAPNPGSAVGGNISGITGASGISFGDVVIGGGLKSTAQFSNEYTPRRLASGQTAAASPAIPGVSYSSTVSATPEALTGLAVLVGLGALVYFSSKK